jgi:hypothetical protein
MGNRPVREEQWTPDEVLLTMEAYLDLQNGADRDQRITQLTNELHRRRSAVEDAVRAVGNVNDPDGRPGPARVLTALVGALLHDPGKCGFAPNTSDSSGRRSGRTSHESRDSCQLLRSSGWRALKMALI